MSKLLRALFISAIATGAAAVVLKLVEPDKTAPPPTPTSKGPYVDADEMSPEQQELLMQELESQL